MQCVFVFQEIKVCEVDFYEENFLLCYDKWESLSFLSLASSGRLTTLSGYKQQQASVNWGSLSEKGYISCRNCSIKAPLPVSSCIVLPSNCNPPSKAPPKLQMSNLLPSQSCLFPPILLMILAMILADQSNQYRMSDETLSSLFPEQEQFSIREGEHGKWRCIMKACQFFSLSIPSSDVILYPPTVSVSQLEATLPFSVLS